MNVKKTLHTFFWKKFRKKINDENIKRLKNENPTIISSNCNGAIILHDLGLRFNTPTVNLFMYPNDFLKFVSDLPKYTDAHNTLEEVKSFNDEVYPIGKLKDIEIHFMHYKTFEEAKEKWFERCKRIDFNNIFIMMTDRDGCTYENLLDFDKLPYNKVLFTNKNYPEINSTFYIKGFEDEQNVGIITESSSILGTRHIDQFDYVKFLNQN